MRLLSDCEASGEGVGMDGTRLGRRSLRLGGLLSVLNSESYP